MIVADELRVHLLHVALQVLLVGVRAHLAWGGVFGEQVDVGEPIGVGRLVGRLPPAQAGVDDGTGLIAEVVAEGGGMVPHTVDKLAHASSDLLIIQARLRITNMVSGHEGLQAGLLHQVQGVRINEPG